MNRRVRVSVPVVLAALALLLSSCGPAAPQVGSKPSPSRSVPAGWNSYADPDHGWFTAYPGDWVVFSSANTHDWKNFVTNDPRIDRQQRSFRLQPGDGLLSINVDKPAACTERTEEPGATESTLAVAGQDVDMYEWHPQTSAGAPATEYAIHQIVNGKCYGIFLLFVSVPGDRQDSVVQGVTSSFLFAA